MEVQSGGAAPSAAPPPPPPRKLRCQDCELVALEDGGGAPLSTWKAPKSGFWKWKTSLKLMRCMACERTYQRCKKKKQRKVSHSLRDSRRARAPRRLHSYVRAPAPARRAAAKIYAPRSCPQCGLSTRPSRDACVDKFGRAHAVFELQPSIRPCTMPRRCVTVAGGSNDGREEGGVRGNFIVICPLCAHHRRPPTSHSSSRLPSACIPSPSPFPAPKGGA